LFYTYIYIYSKNIFSQRVFQRIAFLVHVNNIGAPEAPILLNSGDFLISETNPIEAAPIPENYWNKWFHK